MAEIDKASGASSCSGRASIGRSVGGRNTGESHAQTANLMVSGIRNLAGGCSLATSAA